MDPIVELRLEKDLSLSFRTPAAVAKFVNEERGTWITWWTAIKQVQTSAMGIEWLDVLVRAWDGWSAQLHFPNNETTAQRRDVARRVVAEIQAAVDARRALISTTRLGAFVLALARNDAESSALVAMCAATDGSWRYLSQGNPSGVVSFWNAFARALPLMAATDATAPLIQSARAASIEATKILDDLEVLRRQCNELKKTIEVEQVTLDKRGVSIFARALRASRLRAQKQYGEIESDWKILTRTYDLKLKTAAPYSYWRGKEVRHKKAAKYWAKLMAYALVIGLIVVFAAAVFLRNFVAEGPWPWLYHAILIAAPGFLAIWVGRLANRQFADQLLRAEDARERSIMVRTLLALSNSGASESAVPEAQLALLLNAIFRPGPGLSSDDSPAVSAAELVSRFVQPQKP